MQTGAIEAVKQEKAVPEKGGRNYELDFSGWCLHCWYLYTIQTRLLAKYKSSSATRSWSGSGTFLFILSGMFMANSIVKRGVTGNCAKLSIGFVLNKFKSFAPEYFAALFIGVTAKVVFPTVALWSDWQECFPKYSVCMLPVYGTITMQQHGTYLQC